MKSSPKSDALRAMREARYAGHRKVKPNMDTLQAMTQPAPPANTEDEMAKRTKAKKRGTAARSKAPKAKKRKAAPRAPKPAKRAPAAKPEAAVTYGPAEVVVVQFLREKGRTRDQINAKMDWTDNTTRGAIAKIKAKLAADKTGTLTKTKIEGESVYRIA